MTDLPLVADKPIDIGVSDFCKECRKCAVTCPTNSITFADRDPKAGTALTRDVSGFGVYNGIEKFKIKGIIKTKRVQWLGYDSGIKPGEQACTVAGCTADHGAAASKQVAGNIGYYFPLKENTNRFVKRD
jgi:ferredoxin